MGEGAWVRVSRHEGQDMPKEPAEADWQLYGWIVWGTDGSDYRLRIGVGSEGQLTGVIEDVEGEWASNP